MCAQQNSISETATRARNLYLTACRMQMRRLWIQAATVMERSVKSGFREQREGGQSRLHHVRRRLEKWNNLHMTTRRTALHALAGAATAPGILRARRTPG